MIFSISDGTQNFKTVNTRTFEDFAQHVVFYNYSLATFKNHDRKNKNFERAEAVGLDFDGGLSIKEAKLRFAQYQHIIAPTRSHQLPKNGEVADRFRVILKLDNPITTVEDYKATMRKLLKENPEADKACKDPARFFYPSTAVESIKVDGKQLKAIKASIKEVKETIKPVSGEKGQLTPRTLEFLLFGAPQGQRHNELYAASKDLQGQGYTVEEGIDLIEQMVANTGNWAHPELTDKDKTTIINAFESENDDTIRQKDGAVFHFEKISELFKRDISIEWLVDELMIEGGISLMAGAPKSGKSTLTRQLAKAVCRGEEFLGRQVDKGKVAYVALEEHPAMLKQQFQSIGVTADDDIMIHVGPIFGSDRVEKLIAYLADYEAKLVVIDTLALFAGITDINSYDLVNKAMEEVRMIARKTGSHVVLIHHTKKDDKMSLNSIMGSQAFLGAVDTAIVINSFGTKRFLTSTGRGLTNFSNCEIVFDKETESYSLGMTREEF